MQKALWVSICALLSTGCTDPSQNDSYPDVESSLVGKNLEDVAKKNGMPVKTDQIGNTIFVVYQGFGRVGSGFSNVCFLTLQADSGTKRITSAKLGSNLNINSVYRGLNVRSDCNRVFYQF